MEAVTLQARFQDAIRDLNADRKLKPVEVRSPPDQTPPPPASSIEKLVKLQCRRRYRRPPKSKPKSKHSPSSSSRDMSLSSLSSGRSRRSISVWPLVTRRLWVTLSYHTYRLNDRSENYPEKTEKKCVRYQKKLQVQITTNALGPSDPISILNFLFR